VLVPTTLLAEQHYQSFLDRFADMPVNIEVLSRFKTAKQQQSVIEQLNSGKIDILIGTHKLLQSDVKFSNLGLIIIDEEHRFGVKQKETLKAMRTEVDVLALTATPIPRTLNMSMAGMRDLSIIATPPAKRLSIKTFVRAKESNLVKEAILRELLRGGQVYYLHNEIKTIEQTARELQELVPEARIGVGHGQMHERQLESVMSDFYHKRFNILLCTTIIETGIDVPSANTIIIERADKFGLAQLHQLRGRVGRSHHQAYAYLLVPPEKKLGKDAEKRLDAISEASDLGAGFTLATHDLEIRGAGELLGDDQSGQIHSIGFSLYMEMLDKAVKAIQRGEQANLDEPLNRGTEVNLHIPAIIPDDYLPDVHSRLIMYKSIANSQSSDELKEVKVEMIDRFGLLPAPINNLFDVTELKLKAQSLGIDKIDVGREHGKFEFNSKTTVDPMNLVTLVQSQPNIFKIEGTSTLKFKLSSETVEQRLKLVEDILLSLQGTR
jgi:transcription-repair coupling factor (superfamily II helicase)